MNLSTRLNERVICLIDMDCFYVQVEEVEAPEYRGKPCGVSQYNPYKGGGLIAVNYEARKFGVKRGMRGEDAKNVCPEFHTFYVQAKRGKADLTKYREASLKIFDIILKHCPIVEKASIDEAYLDLTDLVMDKIRNKTVDKVDLIDSFVYGSFCLDSENDPANNLKTWLEINSDLSRECSDVMLIVGASIVQDIRKDIENTLGYHCSAGIAQNKTLAKLCCGLNKPNKQTILPSNSVESLLEKIPINKIKNLGGKLGAILIEELSLNTVGDLARQSLVDLVKHFGEKTGTWLNQISHGIDLEPVMSRQAPKSIGCSKNFRGKMILNTTNKVEHWVRALCEELEERLESDKKNNQREPTLLVIQISNEAGTFSKSTGLTTNRGSAKQFIIQSMDALNGFNKSKIRDQWCPGIYTLGISATKFVELDKNKSSNPIAKFFSNATKPKTEVLGENAKDDDISEIKPGCSSNLEEKEEDEQDPDLTEDLDSKSKDSSEKTETNTTESEKIVPVKPDIRSLFLKQQEKIKKAEEAAESDLDADNYTDSEDIQVIFEEKSEPKKEIKSFFKKSQNEEKIPIQNFDEEVDLVLCQQCNKKILCWNMPEHEDFHFAQMISKQESSSTAIINSKKRQAEETPKKENLTQKESGKSSKNGKKQKTDPLNSQKANVKSINSYFQKKSE